MEENGMKITRDVKMEPATPTSSPPTPPSPLPISVGPGNQKYLFSPSPSPSPPFSPSQSTDKLPLLHEHGLPSTSTFSLDRQQPPHKLHDPSKTDSSQSCLIDLLEWFVARCCTCCSRLSESSHLPI